MVLDVGGGTTDIAVLSLGSVVLSDTVRVAGDRFDQALIRYMKRKHELAIGERSAEDLKIAYGRAHIEKEQQVVEIRGRSLATGLPEAVPVATNELVDALAEPLRQIMEHVRALFEQTPPELAADITESGICLTGGGAQLRGLDRYIAEHHRRALPPGGGPGQLRGHRHGPGARGPLRLPGRAAGTTARGEFDR